MTNYNPTTRPEYSKTDYVVIGLYMVVLLPFALLFAGYSLLKDVITRD